MIWPPSILRVHIADAQRTRIRLWLPLFIVWPILLIITALLLPVLVLVAMVFYICRLGWLVRAALILPQLLAATRGLRVNINGSGGQIVRVIIQ